jgi:hypothetical protein
MDKSLFVIHSCLLNIPIHSQQVTNVIAHIIIFLWTSVIQLLIIFVLKI